MKQNEKNTTINDIARLSGVSKGTVDRVLHNRSDVSEKTRKKVQEVIAEIGYEPNIYASMLSLKKSYSIIAIIPSFQHGEYWEMVYEGIIMAQQNDKNSNVTIDIIYFNQFDFNSFSTACSHTLSLKPSAVLIAPIYKKLATDLSHSLQQLNIPIVCIDTKLVDANYLAYFGVPQFESGYLAAHLLFGKTKSCEIVNFKTARGEAPPNESTSNRYKGIVEYAKDHDIKCTIHNCLVQPNNFMENIKILDQFFEEHPHIDKLITLNSRAYMIAEWMEIRNIQDKTLIGFDALKKNTDGLKKGYISTLITEKTSTLVHQALNTIINHLIFNKLPENKNNYTSMDIINKYNVDFY